MCPALHTVSGLQPRYGTAAAARLSDLKQLVEERTVTPKRDTEPFGRLFALFGPCGLRSRLARVDGR